MTLPVAGWVLVAVAVGGALVGWATARRLATAGYRLDDEEHLPPPRLTWWPVPALAGLAVFTTWHLGGLAHGAALPAYLLFCWLTVALVWIDVDVHRLPFGLVVPAMPWLVLLLAIASVADGSRRWVSALVGALLLWLLYVLLAVLPGGGVGGGDVRLAPLVGGLLGWLGPGALVVGTMATFLVGGLAALALLATRRVGLRGEIAFGPAMCVGVFVAIGWSSPLVAVLLGT
ncbi:MAG TPA: prepilin peptidase [Dermatophilaceae bacterium]|nr:prepilin peptidase [Dermatophilaceae bacterium]